ncbi:hypothetical protein BDW02DRAFT_501826 [Decorospora gaudefroyi]|uniref:Uncharacterized protein n=1 Tax=Decorospora gaudefroyi TaxID=184978 RepID=A0A6A5K6Q4_9PLEO|nr:hypothetical protein BDW02DRAFT_501826 [Decorospora gaudefroyi]
MANARKGEEEEAPQNENTMLLAEILSDLVSLRICDPSAALSLVSAHPATSTTDQEQDQDTDLARAKELVRLHYEVKEKEKRGELGRGLEGARQAVERAVGG